ncbi:MAG TPA: hypothetical protein VHX38_37765 [Pseudonocardiaceae bacterium]|jgi:hypothetical protein|nr:hypothetical protein [Pseudonocardiaceae bacterium]
MTRHGATLAIGLAIAAGGLLTGCGPSAPSPGGSAHVSLTPSSEIQRQPCPTEDGDIRTNSGTCLYFDPSLTPPPSR